MLSVRDVSWITFSQKTRDGASLGVYASPDVPFSIARVFVISADKACERGCHAHKVCTQLLVCLKGRCCVAVDDGHVRQKYILDSLGRGLLLPPTIWAEQSYEKDSVLMVLADYPYDESDYIREYRDYLSFRQGVSSHG